MGWASVLGNSILSVSTQLGSRTAEAGSPVRDAICLVQHPVTVVTQGSTRQGRPATRPGAEPSLLQPGLDLSNQEKQAGSHSSTCPDLIKACCVECKDA